MTNCIYRKSKANSIQLSRSPLPSVCHWIKWRGMSNFLYHLISMQKSNSKLPIFSRTLAEVWHSHPFHLFLSTASQQAVQSCCLCILYPAPNTEDKDITYIFLCIKSVRKTCSKSCRPGATNCIFCSLDCLRLCTCIAALSTEILSALYRP